MEIRTTSPFEAAILPGVFTAVGLIIFRLILFLLDVGNESGWNYTIYTVLFLGILFGTINYRDKYPVAALSYGGAFTSGFAIGLISTFIFAIFSFFFFKYIDPSIVSEVMLKAEESILTQNPNINDEDLDKALTFVRFMSSPLAMAVIGFLFNLVISVILSLLIAIFAKREDRSIA